MSAHSSRSGKAQDTRRWILIAGIAVLPLASRAIGANGSAGIQTARTAGDRAPTFETETVAFTALPEQLGLKLEPTTGGAEVPVVDSAEDPTIRVPLPLLVEKVEVRRRDPAAVPFDHISISVHNIADRTIVAWGVSTVMKFADRADSKGGESMDVVEDIAVNRRPEIPVLPPDGRHTIIGSSVPSNRTASDVVSVTADPTFVIFDDDTALGEERDVKWIFDRRASNHRAWPVIEKIVTDATARLSDPYEALLDAQKTLEAITDEGIRKSGAFTWIQLNLSSNLKIKMRNFAPFLIATLDEIRTRRAAAERHFQRR